MPLSNVPLKNPGRYLEQFVKIVQPRGGQGIQGAGPAVQLAGRDKRQANAAWISSSGTGGQRGTTPWLSNPPKTWQQ